MMRRILSAAVLIAICGARVRADTCVVIGSIEQDAPFPVPGDVVRIRMILGTGSILGGTRLIVNRLRFDLDCRVGTDLRLPAAACCERDRDDYRCEERYSSFHF